MDALPYILNIRSYFIAHIFVLVAVRFQQFQIQVNNNSEFADTWNRLKRKTI